MRGCCASAESNANADTNANADAYTIGVRDWRCGVDDSASECVERGHERQRRVDAGRYATELRKRHRASRPGQ
jgi:hypothetical protein